MKKINLAMITLILASVAWQSVANEPAPNGYELFFNGKRVSGLDAASYTLQQSEENCAWNINTKSGTSITCLFNKQDITNSEAVQSKVTSGNKPTSIGYELFFNGKRVSGPDAASYTLPQSEQNCAWNINTKSGTSITCLFNKQDITNSEAVQSKVTSGKVLIPGNNPPSQPCVEDKLKCTNPFGEGC